ncbi:MAG: hypothetical protein KGL44_03835 [Sphingomonadales bacterium]|nr:hypothetical protein [Sphingomonadales bacterium]
MRGEISSAKFDKRHPYDWYVEEQWVTGQLIRALDGFRAEAEAGEAIWDPSCGRGNIPAVFNEHGFKTYLSDVVDRVEWGEFSDSPRIPTPEFFSADFREMEAAPAPCSLVFNPPYSYIKGIAEAFVRHALKLTSRRVCAVLHLTQRPSMPPGDRIALMGGRAFRGGMIDYCWIVWNVRKPTLPGQTRTIWLPPLAMNSAIIGEDL